MKICPRCGGRNENNFRFCGECGLELTQVPVVAEEPIPQPQPQPQPQPTPQPTPVAQPKAKKPLPKPGKKLILPLVECVALIVAIAVFYNVGASRTDPAKVAERYVQAISDGDWSTICAVTDVPDSPFLTQEGFEAALEYWDILGGTVTQLSSEVQSSNSALDSYVRTVKVEFLVEGSSLVRTMNVSLVKGESKELFFFNSWQVADSLPFIAEDYSVWVPTGATLVVDGLVLDDSYLVAHDSDGDQYTLDLFVGEHAFSAVTDFGIQSWTQNLWDDGDAYYAGNLTMSESTQLQLEGMAKEMLNDAVTAALNQQGLSTLTNSYSTLETAVWSDIYDGMTSYLYPNDNRRALAVTLSDFELWDSYLGEEDGQVYAWVTVGYQVNTEFANLSYGYYEDSDNQESTGTTVVTFLYQDGSWIPNYINAMMLR
jgi:hypothetical protein